VVVFSSILIVISFLILNYLFLVPLGGYWSTYFFYGLLVISLIGNITYFTMRRSKFKIITGITTGAYVILALLIAFVNVPLFRANAYRDLLPKPREMNFSERIHPFEISKAPIVTYSTAMQIVDKAISLDGTLGSRAEIVSATLQNVNGKLYYVAPLQHSGLFAWFNNREQGTPYIMVNANNKQYELVKCKIRYQPNAYFGQDLARKLYYTKAMGYTDFTFEIDDQKHPYWTASIYKNKIGFGGQVVVGTALVDAETGKVKLYSVSKTPKWVDRIQPEELVVKNIDLHGKYIRGFSPFNNNNKIKATEGVGIVYNEGKCYYYTGITSVGKDQSSLGFYLVDTRTMQTTYFKMSGATEYAAIRSAEGKVQNLGYEGSFPTLLNVDNKATYFIPLQDKNGLTKLYAMVNTEDHTVLGTGESVEDCKIDYLKALFAKNQLESSTGSFTEITGVVKRISTYTLQGNSCYLIILDNNKMIFNVPINQSLKLPLTKEGDQIKLKYLENKELAGTTTSTKTTMGFENLNL